MTVPPIALVVEDDELQREILSEFLKDESMDVIQCESAETAELIIARVGAELSLLVTDFRLLRRRHGCRCRLLREGTVSAYSGGHHVRRASRADPRERPLSSKAVSSVGIAGGLKPCGFCRAATGSALLQRSPRLQSDRQMGWQRP